MKNKKQTSLVTKAVEKTKFPAGRYLITDPCYVFGNPHEFWLEICHVLNDRETALEIGGYPVVIVGTAYGDGEYPILREHRAQFTQLGTSGVDAGLLAIIPEAAVNEFGEKRDYSQLGVWIELAKPETVQTSPLQGNWSVGPFHVITRGICQNCNTPLENDCRDLCTVCEGMEDKRDLDEDDPEDYEEEEIEEDDEE